MAILQVLLNAIEFGMTMLEAVSAPRFAATSNAIDICNRVPRRVQQQLERDGYQVIRSPFSFDSACVYAIRLHPDGLDGGADPGGDASTRTIDADQPHCRNRPKKRRQCAEPTQPRGARISHERSSRQCRS